MYKGFTNLTRLLSLLLLSFGLFACQATQPAEVIPSHTPETVESEEVLMPAQTQTHTQTQAPTQAPTDTVTSTTAPEASPEVVLPTQPQAPTVVLTIEGLTYEEMLSSTPPPPENLHITAVGDGVRLVWDPAPSPYPPHNYSDIIIGYNIYRRTEGEMVPMLYDTVKTTSFVDENVDAGETYYYSVSATHEGPLEGQKTEELPWPQPYP